MDLFATGQFRFRILCAIVSVQVLPRYQFLMFVRCAALFPISELTLRELRLTMPAKAKRKSLGEDGGTGKHRRMSSKGNLKAPLEGDGSEPHFVTKLTHWLLGSRPLASNECLCSFLLL